MRKLHESDIDPPPEAGFAGREVCETKRKSERAQRRLRHPSSYCTACKEGAHGGTGVPPCKGVPAT
jgi:hypothetical protein